MKATSALVCFSYIVQQWRMDKENVAHIHSKITFSHKNEAPCFKVTWMKLKDTKWKKAQKTNETRYHSCVGAKKLISNRDKNHDYYNLRST